MNRQHYEAAFPRGNKGFRLLTPGNPKTEKGRGAGFWTFVLHLAPAQLSGFNVCPMATRGCRAACLNTAGRGGIMAGHGVLTAADVAAGIRNTIQHARIRKTQAYFQYRHAFMATLVTDINKAIAMAKREGFTPVFRLNATSDIRWETVTDARGRSIFDLFPLIQFYDYTKLPNRKNIPANYNLTFSLADGNEAQARAAVLNGLNVAAVFRNKETVSRAIDSGFMGLPVFCGDDSDLRFLDPRHHIIALYAKGNAKRDTSGFVIDEVAQ